MKRTSIYKSLALALAVSFASCDGLDQYPTVDQAEQDIFADIDGYKMSLAKVYASYVIRGQEEGGGNADLNDSDPYYCSRSVFNLQEVGTDDIIFTWAGSDELLEISYLKGLTGQSKWIAGAYYSLYYIVTLSNNLIKHCEGSSDAEIQLIANEARFMRAFAYAQILDLWPCGAFTTEKDEFGVIYEPRTASRAEMFDFVTSELKDLTEKLPATNEQYRANKYVAAALLSRLYLNAPVYMDSNDTKYYDECIKYSEMVYEGGYALEKDFFKLFNAENYKRTNEIIFSFYTGKDGANGNKGYGSTTQIICGEANSSSDGTDKNVAEVLGCKGNVWQLFRARKEAAARFGEGDSRNMFFSEGRKMANPTIVEKQAAGEGYVFNKFCNTNDDGSVASDYSATLSMVDLPVLRLSEVYLNEAEAILRGGKPAGKTALELVNAVRQRAGASDFTDADLTATGANGVEYWNILEERGREFLLESLRRTDLIRFGAYAGPDAKYYWEWKGGVYEGTTVDAKYKFYPLPIAELSVNSALKDPNYN